MDATTSLTNTADGLSDKKQVALNHFWDSAEDVAMSCMLITQRLRFMDSDLAYMLGLFHNAGIPLLMHKHPNYLSIVSESYQCHENRIIDTENKNLNTNHAVLGYYISRSWKLPKIISSVIAIHHNGNIVFADKTDPEVDKISYYAVLKMAEHIAGLHTVLGNQETDSEWQTLQENALDCLGLSESEYDDILTEASERSIGNHSALI